MSEKTNKELAVDIAIAYIESSSRLVHPNGGSAGITPIGNVVKVIETVFQTLENLGK